ncbi:MAG: thermonuclease family protein [Cyanobacteriota bacterium]|nr:thermonuclease family protein [Cyanobacteriota bacterium]
MKRDRNLQQILLSLTGITLVSSLLGCELLFGSDNLVQRVSDGDTITALDPGGNKLSVRFACVDAPEVARSAKQKKSRRLVDKSQFKWGERAKKRVEELVEQGGDRVTLNITDTDRYGRQVAEVRLNDGTFVQEVLAREGLALVYRPYLKNCPSADAVEQAEAEAKRRRRGLWSDSRFVPPWDYRKQ